MGNKKIFAVIDTNVLVSALISTDINSFPLRVMAGVYSGIITPVYNMEIIQEYEDVLRRDKFHLDCNDIESAIGVFEQLGLNLERTEVTEEVFPDPKDVVFYEVKMSKEDAYLITGNIKHFPNKPLVVTPKEIIEILGL